MHQRSINGLSRRSLLAAFGVAATCGLPPAVRAGSASAAVEISNFTFQPPQLTIHAGAAVVFRNADDIPHQVVANDGSFRSAALDSGDTASIVFSKPGSFPYYCGLHPHMQGKVIVLP